MTPEKFRQVEDLFFEARQQPPAGRSGFLRDACPDAEVRREVERLLAVDRQAESMDSLHDRLFSGTPAHDPSEDFTGRKVGPYEFTAMVARGGMGVVYRAVDTRLGRNVAVKALPSSLVQDPARRSRLVREAKILASLSHPNIATVFDLEHEDGADFLVMELVEGETLHQRLRRGAMPIEDALTTGAAIAAGLEAAHEAGVVHRDLKPANVMFASSGRVKVLDFGLAREMPSELERLREQATQVTREGVILGTPGYMSPEQARGLPLDRRTDVFSFGCVLFECLTGKVAFDGQSQADIIAAVLEREPDWAALPAKTPPSVRTLLRRCLVKNASQRLRDMGDIRLELEDALRDRAWAGPSSSIWTTVGPPTSIKRPWLPRMSKGFATMGMFAMVLAAGVWLRPESTPVTTGAAKRFAVPFPVEQFDLSALRLAMSRDGRRLVYSAAESADGGTSLFHHDFARAESKQIPGTEQGWMPFLSPDGEWMGFFLEGVLKKRRVEGGETVGVVETFSWFGASWGPNGQIAYVPYWNKPIAFVSDQGGAEPKLVTRFRDDKGDLGQMLPHVTRDGKGVLFAVWRGREDVGIDYVDLASGKQHTVVERGCTPRLAMTPYGEYLLWERQGSLFAAKWDSRGAAVTGPEAPIADGVLVDLSYFTACFDVTDDGTLAYVPGPRYNEQSRLSWLVPEGDENERFNASIQPFAEPRFSADGTKLSVILKGSVYQGYLYDLTRGSYSRVASEHDCTSGSVSPDGRMYAYASNRGGYSVWLRSLDTGHERQIVPPGRDQAAQISWTPDSKQIIFAMSPDPDSVRDLWTVTLEPEPELRQLTNTTGEETFPRVSPDGKWLAFCSSASGRREVYVAPLADPAQRRQVTFDGANQPEWSADGRGLYYISGDKLMRMPFDNDGGVTTRVPALRTTKRFGQSDFELGDYVVGPDDRILVVEPAPKRTGVSNMTVILNWHQLLPANAR